MVKNCRQHPVKYDSKHCWSAEMIPHIVTKTLLGYSTYTEFIGQTRHYQKARLPILDNGCHMVVIYDHSALCVLVLQRVECFMYCMFSWGK